MSESPKGNDFAKKVQRQLSRGKEKVRQKLGKTVETRDDQFERCLHRFNDQHSDGNRIYKDLRGYINAVRDMREASRRLFQSLFDVYENDWMGEEDLGAIVEGEDLLWNDYEVKMLDQSVRTMESYVSQFPDVKEKIAKRGRKLVDYDSSRHNLEALQTAKKRDDLKIQKAKEEENDAKRVYEGINSELKEELPVLFESRIGCYVAVFSAMSDLRDTFYKEMKTMNLDLQNVIKELQNQYPDKKFAVRGTQRYGSLRRRTLLSPKAWKASFSDFHLNYSPRPPQRSSFRSPGNSRHSTLSRDGMTFSGSSQSVPIENLAPESREAEEEPSQSQNQSQNQNQSSAQQDEHASGDKSGDDSIQTEKEKEGESKPPPKCDPQEDKGANAPPSDSSSEQNNSCDSESLDAQLSAADSQLHIEEDDGPATFDLAKPSRQENGGLSGFSSDAKDLPHKETPATTEVDSKSTDV